MTIPNHLRAALAGLTTIFLVACAGGEDPTGETPAPAGDAVTTETGAGGVRTTVVNASDAEAWIHLDLESGQQVRPDDPTWDLAFSRFRVQVNGGVSGDGGVVIAPLVSVPLADVERAPAEGWITDEAKSGTDPERPDFVAGTDADLAFERAHAASDNGWYVYDGATHVLTPADVTYAIESAEGGYFALRFADYYDAAGTPGFPRFDWRDVEPPEEAPSMEIDARSPTYLDLDTMSPVSVVDPTASDAWDLAVNRTFMQTNSGVSGPGLGGARWAPASGVPTVGYAKDAMLPLPGPPGAGEAPGNPILNEWYDYDPATHTVTPKPGALLIRGAAGGYARLRVLAYEGGVFEVDLTPVEPVPEVVTLEVAATSTGAWTHVDLALGAVVEPDARWDVAFRRTQVRTNGGASGDGGAAAQLADAAFDALTEAPEEGWVEDVEIAPERPGATPYAGNEALGAWFDYDRMTHVVSPKDEAYLVRTADGMGYAKLRIAAWDAGTYTLEYVYTGPGRRSF